MMDLNMLSGRSAAHLEALDRGHRLHPEAKRAFLALQAAAAEAGFDLQPASSFRDFERQKAIWNGKFSGQRPVLDKDSHPIPIECLSEGERCEAILRWSALPGASRHHWGSDLDIYDPTLLPEGQKLQLIPAEYEAGGYFYPLTCWLDAHLERFDFYRPFTQSHDGVACEPWHISYRPLALVCETWLTPTLLREIWQDEDIGGKHWLESHLEEVFARFITPQKERT